MIGLGAGKLILIVEDNEKNMKLVRDVLRFHGFRTIEATDGDVGVVMARENLPDLILMDLGLPGLDGVSATEQLKGEQSTAQIPIVALTASVMPSDRARVGAAGFSGLIAKPIDVMKFAEQVLAYCRPSETAP